jgi:hypothetical protein
MAISLDRCNGNTGHFHSKRLCSNKEPESSKIRYNSKMAEELAHVMRVIYNVHLMKTLNSFKCYVV